MGILKPHANKTFKNIVTLYFSLSANRIFYAIWITL